MKTMSAETLASILVKPCVLNMEELYYVTTTGQLYPFNSNGYKRAVQYQLQYLNTLSPNSKEDEPVKPENSEAESQQLPLEGLDD